MVVSSDNSPLFAGRYRFEPVDEDWDTGRTGFTHLAYDFQENRIVVIKRADVTSPHSRQHEYSLQNESNALRKLVGLGVPKLYDVSQAVYGDQNFTYLVMEYIDGLRVEKEVSSLEIVERARILLELFRLLAKSHHRGIANGDVDLKHLFWSRKEQKLSVIDWGNANITDPSRYHQSSFDMARSAEIIYALVVQEGVIPATGSLALPEKERLLADLIPLPEEFYRLCKWAPRNPSEDVSSPYTALDMFAVTRKWISKLDSNREYSDSELDELIIAQQKPQNSLWLRLAVGGLIAALFLLSVGILSFFVFPMNVNATITPNISTLEYIGETLPPTTAVTPVLTSIITPTQTLQNQITAEASAPGPRQYSAILGFDSNLPLDFKPATCWKVNTQSGSFDNKRKDGQWQFKVDQDYSSSEPVKLNLTDCLNKDQVSAIAINFWFQRLAANSEFGIYLDGANSSGREYVFRTDIANDNAHLLVREKTGSIVDYIQLRIKPNLEGEALSQYYQYSVKLFLVLNDQGYDTIYVSPGSDLRPFTTDELNINLDQMKKVDTHPFLESIQSFGLIGNGPDIQVLIWPLVFYEDISR